MTKCIAFGSSFFFFCCFCGFVCAQQTRIEFFSGISNVRVGMSADEVRSILGEPDEIADVTFFFKGKDVSGSSMRYGVVKPGGIATLGKVELDSRGKVIRSFGSQGDLPDPEIIDEGLLKDSLSLVDSLPRMNGFSFDPYAFLVSAKKFQEMGQKRFFAVIREYVRINTGVDDSKNLFEVDLDRERSIFLALQFLHDFSTFDPRDSCSLGAYGPEESAAIKNRPNFPLVLDAGIPLLVVRGISLYGSSEPITFYLSRLEGKVPFLEKPVEIPDSSLEILRSRLATLKDSELSELIEVVGEMLDQQTKRFVESRDKEKKPVKRGGQ